MEFVTKYYRKELVSQKLYIRATGAPAPFEDVGGDDGVFATDNPVYTSELDMAVASHVGGVIPITQQEYEEYKKKASERPSLSNLVRDRNSLSFLSLPQRVTGHANLAVAGEALHGQLPDTPKSEPIKVPLEFQRPRTGKFLKKQEE